MDKKNNRSTGCTGCQYMLVEVDNMPCRQCCHGGAKVVGVDNFLRIGEVRNQCWSAHTLYDYLRLASENTEFTINDTEYEGSGYMCGLKNRKIADEFEIAVFDLFKLIEVVTADGAYLECDIWKLAEGRIDKLGAAFWGDGWKKAGYEAEDVEAHFVEFVLMGCCNGYTNLSSVKEITSILRDEA